MSPASSRDICEHTSIPQVTSDCQRFSPDAVVVYSVELRGSGLEILSLQDMEHLVFSTSTKDSATSMFPKLFEEVIRNMPVTIAASNTNNTY